MKIRFYNSLTRKKEIFKSRKLRKVEIYSCGPTVYNYAHIGNLRTYIFSDILRKVLKINKYQIHQVINITDVGHLTSDNDTGEDKVEEAAKKENKNAWQIASFYTKAFKKDLNDLNIEFPETWAKATKNIKQMIDLIKKLEQKGYTYKISDGIYFDTSKFKKYGELAQLDIKGMKEGIRVKKNLDKKNPTDFALWKFSKKKEKRQMEWDSPWGKGFPGWHIECSAMAMRHFGPSLDIHTGGIDHIPTHHTNEIAQSEAATNKKFVNYWLHGEFLKIFGKKMAKSTGKILTLSELKKLGFSGIDYRFLILKNHYRSKLDFNIEKLKEAQKELRNIKLKIIDSENKKIDVKSDVEILKAFNDDLNVPKALELLHKFDNPNLWLKYDTILSLNLKSKSEKLTEDESKLIKERENYKIKKQFKKADKIRNYLENRGIFLKDTKTGVKALKIDNR
jgi:cysteinyl-tRNA synthetase